MRLHKKLFSATLSTYLLLQGIFTNNLIVYANNTGVVENTELTESGDTEVEVSITVDSEFSVKIPKKIILGGSTKQASYNVYVKGNIGGNDTLSVTPDNEFALKQQNKTDGKATVSQPKTKWIYSELDKETYTNTEGIITATDITAGTWKGTMVFTIKLSTVKQFSVRAIDENDTDLNASAILIEGDDANTLLDELVDSEIITSPDEVDALVEITTDSFTGNALTSFDVSGLAEEGQSVVLYHYDEETSVWEYVGTGLVDENGIANGYFQSFSPVAIIVTDAVSGLYEDRYNIMAYSWQELKDANIITIENGQLLTQYNGESSTNGSADELAGHLVIDEEVTSIGYNVLYKKLLILWMQYQKNTKILKSQKKNCRWL